MKIKALLIIMAMLWGYQSSAQGLVILDENDNDITADTLFIKADAGESDVKAQIFLRNDSEDRLFILARKIEVEILEGTDNTFCWNGACFPPDVYETPEGMAMMLNSGETTEPDDFYGEYYPSGQEGVTIIEYEFFSPDKDFEAVKTTVVYDTTVDHHDAPELTFNIVNGAENVPVDQVFVVSADQAIRHEDGSDITPETLPGIINFLMVLKDYFAVDFDAHLNDEHTEITIMPSEPLAFDTHYMIEIAPLMGVDGEVSEPFMIVFSTEEDTDTSTHAPEGLSFGLSDPMPNPVRDNANISFSLPAGTQNASIQLFTVSGSVLENLPLDPSANSVMINTAELQNGIYFYSLVVDGRITKTKKLIVSK